MGFERTDRHPTILRRGRRQARALRLLYSTIDDLSAWETPPLPKKPNYRFDKRRRELDKKQKKEEKQLRKLEAAKGEAEEPAEEPDASASD